MELECMHGVCGNVKVNDVYQLSNALNLHAT